MNSTRFKIIEELLEKKDPLTLTSISKNLKIDKELVFHHLKNLKEEYVVAETENKEYALHPFFYDVNIMEILNFQMKTVVLIMLHELEETGYTEEQLQDAVINNLNVFIKKFASDMDLN